MVQDVIDRLVAGTYADPDGGASLRVDTRAVVIASTTTVTQRVMRRW